MRSTTLPSAHMLKTGASFRICTEEVFVFHHVCKIVPESVGSPESEHRHASVSGMVGSQPHPVAKSEFKQGEHPAVPLPPIHWKFSLLL